MFLKSFIIFLKMRLPSNCTTSINKSFLLYPKNLLLLQKNIRIISIVSIYCALFIYPNVFNYTHEQLLNTLPI